MQNQAKRAKKKKKNPTNRTSDKTSEKCKINQTENKKNQAKMAKPG